MCRHSLLVVRLAPLPRMTGKFDCYPLRCYMYILGNHVSLPWFMKRWNYVTVLKRGSSAEFEEAQITTD